MKDFLLLMHGDAPDPEGSEAAAAWERYLGVLRASGHFDGGSSMGPGALFRKGEPPTATAGGVSGFLRVRAADLHAACAFLKDNPVFEAGGTVEIRELPKD